MTAISQRHRRTDGRFTMAVQNRTAYRASCGEMIQSARNRSHLHITKRNFVGLRHKCHQYQFASTHMICAESHSRAYAFVQVRVVFGYMLFSSWLLQCFSCILCMSCIMYLCDMWLNESVSQSVGDIVTLADPDSPIGEPTLPSPPLLYPSIPSASPSLLSPLSPPSP